MVGMPERFEKNMALELQTGGLAFCHSIEECELGARCWNGPGIRALKRTNMVPVIVEGPA